MRIYLLSIVLVIMTGVTSLAQQTITGNVSNKEGIPLSNVIITIKGSEIKTTTDELGTYSLTVVKKKGILTFQSEGYATEEVKITKNILNITMSFAKVDLFDLSLEELMNIKVTSASNKEETLSEVPATLIVISTKDIEQRGYTQLDQIFDDLPGMQLSRSYGNRNYYKNYWRGYRNSFSEPYLIMVDGLLLNDMFFSSGMYLPTIPLSNIEHIEVVYGPVSSVYGANAFMGVVNVITKKDNQYNGTSLNMQTTSIFKEAFTTDLHILVKKDRLRLSVAGKIQSYNLSDIIDNNSYEYLKNSYQEDRSLWGGTLNVSDLGANAKVPRKEKGFDVRLFYDNTEIGLHTHNINAGWGYEYPTDRALISTLNTLQDAKIYLKHKQKFNDKISARFLLAYRQDFSNNIDWIEGYNRTNNSGEDIILGGGYILNPNESVRIIDHSNWTTYSTSYIAQQDFDIQVNNKLSFNVGLKYEQKNFSNQLSNYGTAFFPDSLKSALDKGFLAEGSTKQDINSFLHHQEEYGTYIQSKLHFTKNHLLNVGLRLDYNSEYKANTTFRAGYIGQFGKFITKILYGQAYQAPTPRALYGSWTAQGSSIDISPEESQTTEASLTYTQKGISSTISAFHVINTNTIVQFSGGASNAGERKITGIDFHLRGEIQASFVEKIQPWMYYSLILNEQENKFDQNDNKIGIGTIGDLSYHNLHFGVTTIFNKKMSLNLIGQYIGERKTIETNPINKIDSYLNMNATFIYKNIFTKGLNLRFKVNNLFGTQYFHPGIKNADAGEDSGYWDGNVWQGSKGWYNSKLPQPKRYFSFSLMFDL